MTGFVEPFPELVAANPGGADDPLGESVIDANAPWFRVYEPRDRRIVIGRGQDPKREVQCELARADGIPIHRRISGGGAVVLAPGMVVVSLRLPVDAVGANAYFARVNAMLIPAVKSVAGVDAHCRGHGDLAIAESGAERKIFGASLRQTSRLALYLGVFLVADAVPLMQRYLRAPSREPDYRAGRGHAEFCTHLSRFSVTTAGLCEELRTIFARGWNDAPGATCS